MRTSTHCGVPTDNTSVIIVDVVSLALGRSDKAAFSMCLPLPDMLLNTCCPCFLCVRACWCSVCFCVWHIFCVYMSKAHTVTALAESSNKPWCSATQHLSQKKEKESVFKLVVSTRTSLSFPGCCLSSSVSWGVLKISTQCFSLKAKTEKSSAPH